LKPDYGGFAGVNSDGDLTFRNSDMIDTELICHEWTHLFQKTDKNTNVLGDKVGMFEFERYFIEDVLTIIECKGDLNSQQALYRSWASFDDINLLENDPYMKWLLQLTNNGTTYPTSIDKSVFYKFALDFGRIQTEYGEGRSYKNGGTYLYHGIDYTPTSAINLFSLVSKTCKY